MKDIEWNDKYNDNYLRLLRESIGFTFPHVFVNNGIKQFVVDHITEAKKQYYIEGSDYMSDSVYDRYEKILEVHEPNHPLLHSVGTGVEAL